MVLARLPAGSLPGLDPAALIGRPLLDLVDEGDRGKVARGLAELQWRHRLGPMAIWLRIDGGVHPCLLGGCRLAGGSAIHLALKRTGEPAPSGHDDATGLPGRALLIEALASRLAAGECGGHLTLIELADWPALAGRLEPGGVERLLAAIGVALAARSRPHGAARLDERCFAVAHDPGIAAPGPAGVVERLCLEADPADQGLAPRAITVALDEAPRTRGAAAARLTAVIEAFLGAPARACAGAPEADRAHAHALGGGFDLVFQPIVDLLTRRVHHQEALTRLLDGGSPVPLVTFAEDAGLVADFDLIVCRRVVDLLVAAPAELPAIAVNLSGRSLESRRFVEALLALVGEGGRLAGRLLFELTETADIHRPDAVAEALQALRRRGFEVCLDDFGSGASAFHYLRAFEVDYLKIDGAYVRHKGPRDRAILAGMAALCRELGVAAIAEMVEDEESVAQLIGLGIRFGQGFLFGRPRRATSALRPPP